MPPPFKYRPDRDMRLALVEARRRGLDFDTAWEEALTTIDLPAHRTHCKEIVAVLDATRAEWHAAYERRPTPFSVAAPRLLVVMADRERAPAGAHPGQMVA